MPGSPRKDRNVLVLFQSVISESCYHFSLLTVLSKAPIARPPIIWPDLALCQEFPPRVAVKNNQLQLFNIPAAWSNGNKQVNQKHKGKSVRNKCPQRIWDIQNVPAIAVNMPKEDKAHAQESSGQCTIGWVLRMCLNKHTVLLADWEQ